MFRAKVSPWSLVPRRVVPATTGFSHLRRGTDLEMVGRMVFQGDQLDPCALQGLPAPTPHCLWRPSNEMELREEPVTK